MLLDLFLFSVIYLLLIIYFLDALSIKTQLIFIGIYSLIFILPTIIIHYNYYRFSSGRMYTFELDYIKIDFGNDVLILSKKDIKEINFYMTPNRIKKSGLINFPFERYYYGEIKTAKQGSVIITCLFSSKIDDILIETYKDILISKSERFFPYIYKN